MGEVVGFVAMSHSPLWNPAEVIAEGSVGSQFLRGVDRARALVRRAAPDAVVVFGPDHFRMFFYRCMPPFAIGIEGVRSLGDYGGFDGSLPSDSELSRELFDAVSASGVDPAFSVEMDIDHGISQPYEVLFPRHDVPIIPIMVNTSAPPLPPLARCRALGAAVGNAIRASKSSSRVLIVGSGGLSHSPPTPSLGGPEAAEWRHLLVTGERDAGTEARRVAMARALVASGEVSINPEWDTDIMAQICVGNLSALCSLSDADIVEQGGTGGGEMRSWVAAAAAWDGRAEPFSYEPVKEWITGMGCVGGFGSETTDERGGE